MIERIWHEVNQRIVYQLKEMLVNFENLSLLSTDDRLQKWTIGYVTRNLVTIGLNRFIESWNHHRIPGPNRGIPYQLALEKCMISPYRNDIPNCSTLIDQYNRLGGDINGSMDDLYPFSTNELNTRLINNLSILSSSNCEVFEAMLAGNSIAVYDFIKSHYEIVIRMNV